MSIAFEIAVAKAVMAAFWEAVEQKRLNLKAELLPAYQKKIFAENAAAARSRIMWREAKTPRENIRQYKEQLRRGQEYNDAL